MELDQLLAAHMLAIQPDHFDLLVYLPYKNAVMVLGAAVADVA
jgi:hypothetical protein